MKYLAFIPILALALTGCASLLTHFWVKRMVLRLSQFVSVSSILQYFKPSKVSNFVTGAYSRNPLFSSLIKTNTRMSRRIPGNDGKILNIFSLSGLSEVVNAIVQWISVYVVNLVCRPDSVAIQPCKSVSAKVLAKYLYGPVAGRSNAASKATSFCTSSSVGNPPKNTSISVVLQNLFNKIMSYISTGFAKIANLVGVFIPVQMNYFLSWKLAKDVKPSKNGRLVPYSINPNDPIPATSNAPGGCAVWDGKRQATPPCKNTSVWVVVKQFAQACCGKIGLSHDTVPSLIGQRPGRVISTSGLRYFSVLVFPMAVLSGCATGNIEYYKSVEALSASNAASEIARYQALGRLADGNDPASKALAALALGGFSSSQKSSIQISPPRNGWDTFVAISQVWAAPLVNAYGISKSADVAINSSNNAMLTSTATTAGFVGIAGKIQAPGAITTTTDRHDSIVTTPTPVVVPDIVQITPVVVPDTVVITPIAQPVTP